MSYYYYTYTDDYGYRNSSCTHICTVCGCGYRANYDGQFPVCHSCQWSIYNDCKEYWFCTDCGKAKLCTPGLGGHSCCTGSTFHVAGILNDVNLQRLDRWGDAHGHTKSVTVERWAIYKQGQLGIISYVDNMFSIEPCTGVRGTPFRCETKEIATEVAKLLGAERVIKVLVPDNVETHSLESFMSCPVCNRTIPKKTKKHSVSSQNIYGCHYCGSKIAICDVCGEHKAVWNERINKTVSYWGYEPNYCGIACKDLKAKQDQEERERKIREETERKQRAFLADRERIKTVPGDYHIIQSKTDADKFLGCDDDGKLILTDFYHALSFYSESAADDTLTNSQIKSLQLTTTNLIRNSCKKIVVCPCCKKPAAFPNFIEEDLCPHCTTILKFCKDCQKLFIIRDDEALWFKNKRMEQPKRCKDCRSSRVRY